MDEALSTHQERVAQEIRDVQETKDALVKHGCKLKEVYDEQETYLHQPEQEILKIVSRKTSTMLIRLHQEEHRYDVVAEKSLTQEQAQALKTHYGVAHERKSTVTHYTYGEVDVYVRESTDKHTLTLQADTIGKELYEELGLTAP